MEKTYRYPLPTVDIIIELDCGGVVLIKRGNPPFGWAIPGGFVDEGESLEDAARREALEETHLTVRLICQMHTYSAPGRDPRFHTITTVFAATATGVPTAGDDAAEAAVFTEETLPEDMAFDHRAVMRDYFRWKKEGFGVFDI